MYWEKEEEEEVVWEEDEVEEAKEARRREGAQHQEQCSGEHTECYVNTLVRMCCVFLH